MHKSIFDLCYYSGAISLLEAYELPVHLRQFYIKCLYEAKKRERELLESSDKSDKI